MSKSPSQSLNLAKKFLGQEVEIIFDRPFNSTHPHYDFAYETNYGYVSDTKAPDGEELDAYYLEVHQPLTRAKGVCIAIIHHLDNDDDKLIVVPPDKKNLKDKDIEKQIHCQEKWFKHRLIRSS